MDLGLELTRWTVRLAVAAYLGRLALGLAPNRPGERCQNAARGLWTVGCVLLWAHVVCAFQSVHHWSHDDAYAHTARETAEKVGIDWGGGLYINYLFMLLWAGDVAWWWWRPGSYRRRSPVIAAALHAFLAFILFNATVVFKEGWLRYAALAATMALTLTAICVPDFWKRNGQPPDDR